MELISLTTAIATLISTKAVEKIGEGLGEKALRKANNLMQLLRSKPDDDNRAAIVLAAQNPELVEQQPSKYGEEVLVEKLRKVANSDSQIAGAVQALADAVKSQPSTTSTIYIEKFAEKIVGNLVGDHNVLNISNIDMRD
jgi:hypothetical protein